MQYVLEQFQSENLIEISWNVIANTVWAGGYEKINLNHEIQDLRLIILDFKYKTTLKKSFIYYSKEKKLGYTGSPVQMCPFILFGFWLYQVVCIDNVLIVYGLKLKVVGTIFFTQLVFCINLFFFFTLQNYLYSYFILHIRPVF
jgi:hypothetical protein